MKREREREAGREGGRDGEKAGEGKNSTKERQTPLHLDLHVERWTCGDDPHVVLPGAGLVRKLYTVSKHFNDLNYIWVCGTHHVQTYLKENSGNVSPHQQIHFLLAHPLVNEKSGK